MYPLCANVQTLPAILRPARANTPVQPRPGAGTTKRPS